LSIVTIVPVFFDLWALRLSFRFLLRELLIGIIELTSGITNPSTKAKIVD
jgi:hypothetical protein